MADVSLPNTLTAGQPENVTHVQENDERLRDALNLDVDSGLAEPAGLSVTGTTRRGKSIISTEQSTSSTSYTTLTTPDQVASVVLPTDGLIAVAYQAMWKNSVGSAGSAAIFLGSNQLKKYTEGDTAPTVQETGGSSITGYVPLATGGGGLVRGGTNTYTGHVTTGQIIGDLDDTNGAGVCYIFAAAGTYTVSVRFKASSGSVTVKERKLWVWTLGF